jgi:hypothetical protein
VKNDSLYLLAGLLLLGGGGAVVYNQTRGLRLNNPGNIEHGSNWQGLAADQPDPRFCKFVDMAHGLRAMAIILRDTYQGKLGLNNVHDIITRWAPPSDNDTAAYIASVAGRMGVGEYDGLNLYDADTLASLMAAMTRQEQGPAAALIANNLYAQGIALS